MTFTNNSDFYIAIHENGINRIINRAMLYVPSTFNFGSSYISAHPQMACNTVNADPSVTASGDPLISVIYPQFPSNFKIPLMNTFATIYLQQPYFIAQLSELQVDFNPGNVITLPETLPSLPSQQLALHARVSIGLSCPPREEGKLDCFSLDLFAELALKNSSTAQFLNMHLTALDVVGIEPPGLRDILDCYLIYIVNRALSFGSNLANSFVSTPRAIPNMYGIVNIQMSPVAIPNNPAVEDHQLKLFMNFVNLKLNEIIGPSGSSSLGSNLAPATSHSARNRQETGPGDLTLAISQATFSKILSAMLNGGITLDLEHSRYGNSPLYIDYQVSASLRNGTISLKNDGKIQIIDLLVSWDRLKFTINIDLPKISIPGFKIPAVVIPGQEIQIPLDGKIKTPDIILTPEMDFPGIELFGNNPDISIPIDLSGDFVSQVSLGLEPAVFYGTGDPRIPNCPNRWQLYVIPQLPIFTLPVELSVSLTSKIEGEIDLFFKNISFGLPDIMIQKTKDALSNLLPASTKLILSDPAKFVESIIDMIENDLGITSQLDKFLYDYLANQAPIFELQDPYYVSVADPKTHRPANDIPIPITYLRVSVNSSEMILEGDIGP